MNISDRLLVLHRYLENKDLETKPAVSMNKTVKSLNRSIL